MPDFNENWPDLRVGDMVYVLGRQRQAKSELQDLMNRPWLKKLARAQGLPEGWPERVLSQAYEAHCSSRGVEPEWTKSVSLNLRRALRMGWIRSEHFEDPLTISIYRKELDFAYTVVADGLIHDVCEALDVFRLEGIKQLSFLHDPVMNEITEGGGMGILFDHNRYGHSFDVMATATLMGHRCHLSEYELRHLSVAAISHDVLTPAGGDAVKFLGLDEFDEDAHYPEIFRNNPRWAKVRERYDLSEELLASIIRGEGKLGKLLDLADKSAYVAHDVDAYVMDHDPRTFRHFRSPASLMEIWEFRRYVRHPLCDLWKYVRVEGEQVVVTDAARLARFLKLRALMFKHLYYNPKARYREQMLATLIIDCLYAEGTLTREQLLSMSDDQLYQLIDQASGRREFGWALAQSNFAPDIEGYPDLATAEARARALTTADPALLIMFEVFPAPSEKAMSYLVRRNGTIQTFREACPIDREAILALGRDQYPVKLYKLSLEKTEQLLSPTLREKLLRRQRERIGLA